MTGKQAAQTVIVSEFDRLRQTCLDAIGVGQDALRSEIQIQERESAKSCLAQEISRVSEPISRSNAPQMARIIRLLDRLQEGAGIKSLHDARKIGRSMGMSEDLTDNIYLSLLGFTTVSKLNASRGEFARIAAEGAL